MPNFYSPYQQTYFQPQAQVPAQPPQIQNGGFVSVRSELEARNYPVGIGTSITFKDENAPYVYSKTMGFSQFDAPRFDKYRLVKEDATETQNLPQKDDSDTKTIFSTIESLQGEIRAIWDEIDGIKAQPKRSAGQNKRKEVVENDSE